MHFLIMIFQRSANLVGTVSRNLITVKGRTKVTSLRLMCANRHGSFDIVTFILVLIRLLTLLITRTNNVPRNSRMRTVKRLPRRQYHVPVTNRTLLMVQPNRFMVQFQCTSQLSKALRGHFLYIARKVFNVKFNIRVGGRVSMVQCQVHSFNFKYITTNASNQLFHVLLISDRPATHTTSGDCTCRTYNSISRRVSCSVPRNSQTSWC